jgi:hypothetical protein
MERGTSRRTKGRGARVGGCARKSPDALWVAALWVTALWVAVLWMGVLWVAALWVAALWVAALWVAALWVAALWVASLWVRTELPYNYNVVLQRAPLLPQCVVSFFSFEL